MKKTEKKAKLTLENETTPNTWKCLHYINRLETENLENETTPNTWECLHCLNHLETENNPNGTKTSKKIKCRCNRSNWRNIIYTYQSIEAWNNAIRLTEPFMQMDIMNLMAALSIEGTGGRMDSIYNSHKREISKKFRKKFFKFYFQTPLETVETHPKEMAWKLEQYVCEAWEAEYI